MIMSYRGSLSVEVPSERADFLKYASGDIANDLSGRAPAASVRALRPCAGRTGLQRPDPGPGLRSIAELARLRVGDELQHRVAPSSYASFFHLRVCNGGVLRELATGRSVLTPPRR